MARKSGIQTVRPFLIHYILPIFDSLIIEFRLRPWRAWRTLARGPSESSFGQGDRLLGDASMNGKKNLALSPSKRSDATSARTLRRLDER